MSNAEPRRRRPLLTCWIPWCFVLLSGGCFGGEVCDDEVDNDGDGLLDCRDPACSLFAECTSCGDGLLDDAEACDDGDRDDNDGCSSRCELEDCGDGRVASNEQCDDGNDVRGDGCSDRCQIDHCSNRRVENGEECDDGNLTPGDGCTARCRIEPGVLCGNARLDPGEQCDDGNRRANDGCGPLCFNEFCGDGVMQRQLGETCDGVDGLQLGDRCGGGCRIDQCGNGRLDANEGCDDGNLIDGDTCTGCRPARCANGFREAAEECDDGNQSGDDGCDRLCHVERCGDGIAQGREVCDDDDDDAFCFDCIPGLVRLEGLDFGASEVGVAGVVPPLSGISEADVDDRFFLSSDFTSLTTELLDHGSVLEPGNIGATQVLREPVRIDLDGRDPIDLVGCNGVVFLDTLVNRSPANNGHVFTQVGVPCQIPVTGDVDDDGAPEIYALGFDAVHRLTPPFDSGRVDRLQLVQGTNPSPHEIVALRGSPDVVVVADGGGNLSRVGSTALVSLGLRALLVFGADLDDDGADELITVADDVISVVDPPQSHPLEFAVRRFTRGDLDFDGVDDVVVIGRREASLLLSTQGHVPSRPFAVPLNSLAVVVGFGDLLFIGGPANQPAVAIRLRLQP
ncbi:MAG: DUF4215 domain-containing protein [Deltaproteobacteria bacterium]|nr:DUF4215 domain-containing protein [Deltaproteobacteria bacterium]